MDRAALEKIRDAFHSISACYAGDWDEAGACASCHMSTYKPHSPDCEKQNAINILDAALAEPVEHRCHLEIETMPDGFEPDGCVLDGGNPDHCMYAKRYGDKAREHCGEWKPFIKKVKP
jgi:hypothetical protein